MLCLTRQIYLTHVYTRNTEQRSRNFQSDLEQHVIQAKIAIIEFMRKKNILEQKERKETEITSYSLSTGPGTA